LYWRRWLALPMLLSSKEIPQACDAIIQEEIQSNG
jgi:hypothetical protein